VNLFSGQTVPVIQPDLRGMRDWTTAALIKEVKQALAEHKPPIIPADNVDGEISSFLTRVYYEFRNLGITPQERALNFAGTNAFATASAISEELGQGRQLDTFEVTRSAVCRPDSDCWEIKLYFYNPRATSAWESRRVHASTIDVSDLIPVL